MPCPSDETSVYLSLLMKYKNGFILACLILLSACHRDRQKDQLLDQAAQMKKAVLAGDAATMGRFFDFPVKNEEFTSLLQYSDDPVDTTDIDSAAFNRYYTRIFTPKVTEIFRHFALSDLSLNQPFSATYTPKDTTDKCMYTYTVEANAEGEFNFSFLSNNRTDMKMSEDDALTCHEFSEFWIFKLKGGKLKFVRLVTAG